ncbi:MAG: DNA translocase FtsK 4TM domain-containing protein [Rhodobacteraceae bacterium]|nr:DNA translocase FtsK 4TM domain-containing protein [Paracoccaceae bacterium]
MASYQAKQRDPLFDSETQAVLERRGKELLGFLLIGLGVAVALMLGSYSPDDPSWLASTDAPAQNALGRIGASIASPLHVIVGLGAWGFALVFAGWGIRFVTHYGEERAGSRVIFAPIAIALGAVYASTHVPFADWGHSFGLGGLFGDTVLGAILGVVPIKATFGLKVLSLVMAVGMIGIGLFVLGFTVPEIRAGVRFLILSLLMAYAHLLRIVSHGLGLAVEAGLSAKARRAARLEERNQAAAASAMMAVEMPPLTAASRVTAPRSAPVLRADPRYDLPEEEPSEALKSGLLSALKRRVSVPEQELVEQPAFEGEVPPLEGDDRIRSKIADVIKARGVPTKPVQLGRREPPVARGYEPPAQQDTPAMPSFGAVPPAPDYDAGHDDLIEDDAPLAFDLPEEPPLSAAPRIPEPEARQIVQHTPRKVPQPSRQAKAEAQPALFQDNSEAAYETPPLSLLTNPTTIQRHHLSDEALEENARMLETVLDDYGVKGEIVSVRPGPVVTMYELEPAPGLKASRVIGLADDIARSMSALSARVSTVPGRSVIGIELPNASREKVVLREILSARDFGDSNMRLPLALGKDIGGDSVVANLAKMPHLLIAGTTGSGKSVAINTMILSLLYKLSPEECRLIMIDPKMLELSVYDGIPHLLSPVVTDPKKAVVALKWVVGEMEERYRKMSKMGVRNIDGFNGRVRDALEKGEMFKRTVQTGFDDETGEPVFETEEFEPQAMPFIVVIVDEMADLMMVAGKEIEACIQRLAQMARASGIHLIMATQRPSVDVITGTIKANFPTRISFQVTSKIDSRTILGEQGAEQLLGMGDMLYMAGGSRITRVHGPFVSDEEVEEIVNYLKSFGPPEYVGQVVEGPDEDRESDIDLVLGLGGNTDSEDALYDQAVAIVLKDRKCSTSYIQRKLAIGYNKAARLVEQMEEQGVVSAANHVGKREILVPEQA